ncbi:hypothetical protein, partial [Belliella pelovolcani]|uniref:hypothetical protein n=1 Tax=Belliella pelovolcani TaxID=529505 RepID=UPI00391C2733
MSNTPPTISNEVQAYYSERLRSLGIDDRANTIESPVYEHKDDQWLPTSETKKKQAFEPHPQGIQINYFLPTGYPIDYKKEGTKFARTFNRIRLFKEKTYEKDGKKATQKYHQEAGSGQFPYLTPGIIADYNAHKEIETLVLIEGEFKAFKSDMEFSQIKDAPSLRFMGIPGIHGFYGGDTNHNREINELIQTIIVECKVKNIVMLLDADTMVVKWEDDKDLYIRQKSFANAVANFRNSLHLLIENPEIPLTHVYFMHMKTKFNETAKGLDDLLIQIPKKAPEILEDLTNFHFAKTYFAGLILTDGQESKVEKYFGLQSKLDFYNLYKDYIGSRPFLYKKTKYEWTGSELSYVQIEDADRY